ncbi:ubiquitin-conjugating enzyme E2 J2 [Culicoides brevitarsis]|uniref:ubiquitin-conjugating enzyme E2 J2 n=1 Tax=Culicoides brevitarsis TaxID=469753 RepID=UPI00307CA43C
MTNQKSITSNSRLKQDYIRLKKDPVPYISAEPLPSNILEWHYVIRGPEDSLYAGGYYHGCLLFSKDFPFKPPSIYMYTPNGRFKTNKRLCLSISDFHPDTWNPAWSISTILTGLLSFMLETTPTLGSCESTLIEKRRFADQSLEFNLKNEIFVELFPDIVEEIKQRLQKVKEARETNNNKIKENGGTAKNESATGETDAENANNAAVQSGWHSLTTNVILFILFLIFALIVNHILKTMND